jgi:hypothetical protein
MHPGSIILILTRMGRNWFLGLLDGTPEAATDFSQYVERFLVSVFEVL